MEHHRKLERMYHGAPINQWFRPRLVVSDGAAEVAIPVRKDFHHAAHAAHGSVAFKALDDATFFAANSRVNDAFVLTASFHIDYLRPISEGTLFARARVVHESARRILAEGVAVDDEGREVARGSGTFMRGRIALSPEVGYE